MSVVERQAIGPGKVLLLVKVANRQFLVGMSEQNINTLAEFSAEELAQSDETESVAANTPGGEVTEPSSKKNLVSKVISQHISSLPLPKLPS